MAKKMEFYEGEEAMRRFEAGMKKFLVPIAKAPKPELQEPQQSSAK